MIELSEETWASLVAAVARKDQTLTQSIVDAVNVGNGEERVHKKRKTEQRYTFSPITFIIINFCAVIPSRTYF